MYEQIGKINCGKSSIGVTCRDQKSIPRRASEMHLLGQVESAGRGKGRGSETGHSVACFRCAPASPGARYLKPKAPFFIQLLLEAPK